MEQGLDGQAAGPATPAYRNYVLFVLFLGYVSNSIDRGILGILMPPIQAEFQLSYTQLGLLGGIAFALFYATFGIPIAGLADRTSRKWVLTVCIILWSGMTALCGLASNFPLLMAARIGTAVGEAGGSPPSHSLIADYFPIERRGTALSIYALGVSIGGIIGLPLAGIGNDMWGWRTVFFVAALPGLFVALLLALTVREPARTKRPKTRQASAFAAIPELWRRPAFRNMAVAAALHAFVWYGASNFNSMFLVRAHGMSTSQIGSWMAVFALAGAAGTFLGGLLSDMLARRRGDARYYMWVPGTAAMIGIPFQLTGYLAPAAALAMAGFAGSAFCASFYLGPAFAMAQALASPRRRAVAASVLLFVQTMIGLGLGPLGTGVLIDGLLPSLGSDALRTALALIALGNLWAGYHYWRASRTVRRDIAAAAQD